jgi:hypothetical protein
MNQPASQDRPVGAVTGVRAGGPRNVLLFTAEGGDFASVHSVRSCSGVHPASIQWVQGKFLRE